MVLVMMSKSLLLILSAYLPAVFKVFSSNTFFYAFLSILMVFYVLIFLLNQSYIDLKWVVLCVSFLCVIVLVQFVYPSFVYSGLKGSFLQISSNVSLLFAIMLCAIPSNKKMPSCKKTVYVICLLFITIQSLFGILQYLTNSTIFPLEIDGQKVSKTLFYSQGSSGSNEAILMTGGHIRAIGLTNSSLTFGLFMLFGIILAMSIRSRLFKSLLLLIFSMAIAMTLTRVIWVAWFFLVVFIFFPGIKNNFHLQSLISNLFWSGQVIFAFVPSILAHFQDNPFFATLLSRFQGYSFFLQIFPINFKNVWIGQNFEIRLLDFKTFGYSLDNQFLVFVLNLGLFSYLLYFIVNRVIIKRLIQIKEKSFASLLLVLPIVGIVNDPSYFVFGLLTIGGVLVLMELGEGEECQS